MRRGPDCPEVAKAVGDGVPLPGGGADPLVGESLCVRRGPGCPAAAGAGPRQSAPLRPRSYSGDGDALAVTT
eukprot:2276840-Pyramimonas_sp.AAC.1